RPRASAPVDRAGRDRGTLAAPRWTGPGDRRLRGAAGTRVRVRGHGALAYGGMSAGARRGGGAGPGRRSVASRLRGRRRLRPLEADDVSDRTHGRSAGARPCRVARGAGGGGGQVHRIVIADPLEQSGLEILRAAGADVRVLAADDRPRLPELVADADALVVRSATKVTRELLAGAARLRVVGRAG